jgi:hypothetical protein
MAPDGRKNPTQHNDGKPTGEMGEGSCFEFMETYPTMAVCRAAAEAFFGPDPDGNGHAPMEQADLPPTVGAAANSAAREFAKNSLSMLWDVAGRDETQFAKVLAQNPMVSQFFDINSPEVRAVIGT